MSIVPFEPEEQLTRQAVNERVGEVKTHLEDRENPHGVAAWQTEVSADTRTVLGLGSGATADDAILQSYLKSIGSAYARVRLLYYDGTPVASEPVVVNPGNKTLYTDREGRLAFLHAGSSASFMVSKYLDMCSNPTSMSTPIGTIADRTLTFPKSTTQRKFTSSVSNVLFSPKVASIDVFCVGGGGGGGAGGGGGGHTATGKNLAVKSTVDNIIVGNGGSGGSRSRSATDGGASAFYGVSGSGGVGPRTGKDGGSGGSGGGGAGGGIEGGDGGQDGQGGESKTSVPDGYDLGGSGGAGQGSTTREFGETSGALYSGGGGGGAGGLAASNARQCGAGGLGGGGDGQSTLKNTPAKNGASGSGGGGGGYSGLTDGQGGSGGSGCVIVRWRYR